MKETVINTRTLSINKDTVKESYRKGLILCDDPDFEIVSVPEWATEAVEVMYGVSFNGIRRVKSLYEVETPEAVRRRNQLDYPALYKEAFKNEGR